MTFARVSSDIFGAESAGQIAAEGLAREGFEVMDTGAVGLVEGFHKGHEMEGPHLDTDFPVRGRSSGIHIGGVIDRRFRL